VPLVPPAPIYYYYYILFIILLLLSARSPQPAAGSQGALELLSVHTGVGDGFGHKDFSEGLAMFIL
jgi:hypothetical protein